MHRLILTLAALIIGPSITWADLKPDFIRLTDPSLDESLEGHWLLDENTNFPAVLNRVTQTSGTRVGVNTADRAVETGCLWQATDQYIGYNPTTEEIELEPIILADSPGADFTNDEITICLFVRTAMTVGDAIISMSNGATNRAFIISGGNSGGSTHERYQVSFSQNGTTYNKIFRTTGGWIGNNPQSNFPNNTEYHHIAVTYSASAQEVKFYINGLEVPLDGPLGGEVGTWGIFDSTADLVLGNYDGGELANQNPQRAFDVRIYSRALSASEIYNICKRYEKSINPVTDTYYGQIIEFTDLYPALQLAVSSMGGGLKHGFYHNVNKIDFPNGSWYLTQPVICPHSSGTGYFRGAGNSTSATLALGYTRLYRSPDWVGDSDALFRCTGTNWRFERIAFYGTTDGVAANVVGIGVHTTRGPSYTVGPAPSGTKLERCTGVGLVALHAAGSHEDENNCDFCETIACSIDNCDYLYWNRNMQGQMQNIERPIGAPNKALIYAEAGGPIYIRRFGSAGTKPVLLIGAVGAQQALYTLELFKVDSQADKNCKIVEMEGTGGPAHIIVERGFITHGERGFLGTNFVIAGESLLTIKDVIGVGKTEVKFGYQGAPRIPTINYERCKWSWGPGGQGTPSNGYLGSAAQQVREDRSVLLEGEAADVATLTVTNSFIGTRYTQGTIDPNPMQLKDYRSNRRPVRVNISGPEE